MHSERQTQRMKHSVRHDLGKDGAKRVAESALKSYSERFAQYSPSVEWQTPERASIGFAVKGMSLKGALEVKDSSFELELDVPFLMRPFQGKAVGIIEEEIQAWIQKTKAGLAG
jgi:hypothetical protein